MITGKKHVPRRWPKVIYRLLRERVSTEKLQTTHESAASKQHSSSRIYDPLCLNIRARADPGAAKRLGFIKKEDWSVCVGLCVIHLQFWVASCCLCALLKRHLGRNQTAASTFVAANTSKTDTLRSHLFNDAHGSEIFTAPPDCPQGLDQNYC